MDVTAAKGVLRDHVCHWRILDDDIRSDHSTIELTVGEQAEMQRQEVRDLKNTDWNEYATVSTCLLRDLLDRWDAVEDDVDTMTNQLGVY